MGRRLPCRGKRCQPPERSIHPPAPSKSAGHTGPVIRILRASLVTALLLPLLTASGCSTFPPLPS
jgi:hypothetical protein